MLYLSIISTLKSKKFFEKIKEVFREIDPQLDYLPNHYRITCKKMSRQHISLKYLIPYTEGR